MAALRDGDFRVTNLGDQEATMMDLGEKGRPPEDPPDAPGLWVRKVTWSA